MIVGSEKAFDETVPSLIVSMELFKNPIIEQDEELEVYTAEFIKEKGDYFEF